MWFVHLLATGATAATRASSAFAMFMAVAILLGLFLLGVVLIMTARRIRQRRAVKNRLSNEQTSRAPDPWKESAKRLRPYPRQSQPPEE